MDDIDEMTFLKLQSAGAVDACGLHVDMEGSCLIWYTLKVGGGGQIHTKRRRPKLYLVETALRFLRGCGVLSCNVDLTNAFVFCDINTDLVHQLTAVKADLVPLGGDLIGSALVPFDKHD